jgi:hypothetical protein
MNLTVVAQACGLLTSCTLIAADGDDSVTNTTGTVPWDQNNAG